MKKKLLLIVCLCVSLMSFAACGKQDPASVDYNGVSYDQLKETSQGLISSLVELDSSELQEYADYYASQGNTQTAEIIESYMTVDDEYGAYIGLGDFKVTKAGKTLSTEQTVVYADREVVLTIVYNYNTMNVTGSNFDAVQSVGEKMSKAGLNTVMGILTVFTVLILISLIIHCFKLIPYLMDRKKNAAKTAEAAPAAPVVEQVATNATAAQDDTELIAVIAAAIAAATGSSTDDFVVRSIKRR